MATDQTDDLAEARATNQRLNRRTQELESELAAYRRAVADWEISEQGAYVPLRTLAMIAKAAGLEVPERWELHYERVERLEAELRRMADEEQPAAEAWDVPDARPGTTDYTLQQQRQPAAADGEEAR